jgi:hypothetical protein
MRAKCRLLVLALLFGVLGLTASSAAGGAKADKKFPGTWTAVNDPSLPEDFKFQGEFVGAIEGGQKLGAQVIALSKGAFQAVVLPGGLPGAGWDGKDKIILAGNLDGSKVELKPATGSRQYLAKEPEKFSATSKFPPPGQKAYTGTISADGTFTGKTDDDRPFSLKKTVRTSPTLGKKAPQGALVLFDGTNDEEWTGGGRVDKAQEILNTDGHNLLTKRKFNDYTVHLEFMEPYRPDARGQGRGNSGFYQVNVYEVQILDSFGLDGKNNECGAIYSQVAPKLNMCLPPLEWQTYDIDFTNAKRDADGKVVAKARITARLNGVVIHDDVAIPTTPGGRSQSEEGTPGALQLQGHGNPLQFKNIWIIEKK